MVEAARQGDSEAFNQLLGRHRGRAFAWARTITGDAHLAEDVVQEALINAFLKLGTLLDMNRFLPWLRKVVSNQARMRMRRGGPYGKERPFTAFVSKEAEAEPDWGNLDVVLSRFAPRSQLPFEWDETARKAIGSDDAETIASLIRVLGQRERDIFAKHFYEQLSPQEIADHYNTSVNSVHQAVSRIRRKLESEKIDIDVRSQIRVHLEQSGLRQVMLDKPGILGSPFAPPGISFLHTLYHILPYSGQFLSMADTAAYSGFAFLINVDKRDIGVDSLGLWEWSTYFTNGMLNVGLRNRYVDYQHFRTAPSSPHKMRKLMFGLDLIRSTIDAGLPAILINGIQMECALVYGYNDEKQLLYMMDTSKDVELPYTRLACRHVGTLPSYEFYAFGSEAAFAERPLERLARLTARIVRHADGLDDTFGPCVNGLRAYDAWIEALEAGRADPLGNAACLAAYGWCREQAAKFWRERLAEAEHSDAGRGRVKTGEAATGSDFADGAGLLYRYYEEASVRYETLARIFGELQQLFPFPDGGDLNNPISAKAAVRLLHQAKAAEEAAVDTIRSMQAALETDLEHAPVLIPIHPFYSFGGKRFEAPKAQAAAFRFDSILVQTDDLRRAIRFYSGLLGLQVAPELEEGPVGLFPLEGGANILLTDLRLDLWQVDWRNLLVVQTTDIDRAFAEVERHRWSIVIKLDRGSPNVQFFIAADLDGHHWMVTSGPLSFTSVNGAAASTSPIRVFLERVALPVKDPIKTSKALSRLFRSLEVDDMEDLERQAELLPGVRLDVVSAFHLRPEDTRLQLRIEDGEAVYRHVRRLGIRILRGPDTFEDGTAGFIVEDPDGTPITIRTAR